MNSKNLPPLIKAADAKIALGAKSSPVVWNVGDHGTLTFHKTDRFGWCIATLPISSARAGSGFVARTYAIQLTPKWTGSTEHEIVSVGNGSHVTDTVTVYLRKNRIKALQPYIDLYNKGMISANNIRDRISTRRANTTLRRSHFGLGLW